MGPILIQLLRGAGVDPGQLSPAEARAALQRARRARGDAYARLSDAQLSDCYNYYLFPNATAAMWADEAVVYRYRPHRTDPERSHLDLMSFSRTARSQRPSHERWKSDNPRIDTVLAQDIAAMQATQRGMASAGYRGLALSTREITIRRMHEEIDRVFG